jgi:hypothetical protein
MKLFKPLFLVIAFSIIACGVNAQKRNNIWCFGDSAGINFNNLNNPVPISTGLRTRGSCASIADTNGTFAFFCAD